MISKEKSSIRPPLAALASFLAGSLLLLTVFGCTAYPKVNNDPAKNNQATFQRDALDCAQAYPDTSFGTHVRQRVSCMNLKGWR